MMIMMMMIIIIIIIDLRDIFVLGHDVQTPTMRRQETHPKFGQLFTKRQDAMSQ